jgi:hypothetical protein
MKKLAARVLCCIERKTARHRRESTKFSSLQLWRLSSLVQTLCTCEILHILIVSLLWIKFNSLDKIVLFLEFTGYFQGATSIHDKNRRLYQHVWERHRKEILCRRPFCPSLSFLRIFPIQLSNESTLSMTPLNYQINLTIFVLRMSKSCKQVLCLFRNYPVVRYSVDFCT